MQLGDGSRCCQREIAEQINVNSVPGISGRAAVELEISANKKYENVKRERDRAQENRSVANAAQSKVKYQQYE